MHSSDITVLDGEVDFRSVELVPPLAFSHGAIEHFTVAHVHVIAADRTGRPASGHGATVLSVPWAWPHSPLTLAQRDQALRDLCSRILSAVIALPAADPIRLWCAISAALPGLSRASDSVPALAALLALAAVDSALHDAWSKAAGIPAYAMYDSAHLDEDLGTVLGPALAGCYPADFLGPGRAALPVQHLVSADDPLTDDEACGPVRSLQDWLRTDGIRHLKLKLLGGDPRRDADRIAAVHSAAVQQVGAVGVAVDPNEGYAALDQVTEMVRVLRTDHPDAAAAVTYIEQPVPRGTALAPHPPATDGAIPILMDEGLSSVATLRTLSGTGWDGIVVKAAKGQTHALLAHSYACANGLFLTVQDLTAVDLAFRHSARLASIFDLSAEHLEYNSRQYAAHANAELTRTDPELATVRDGTIRIGRADRPGIY